MSTKPELKIKILEDLYLQLLTEIALAENDIVSPEQITIVSSEDYVFELKFKKRKKDLYLIRNEQD